MQVLRFVTENGIDVFGQWLLDLRDVRAAAKIAVRIDRLAAGNLGDHKYLREGIWELRIDYGPGYRVYFAKVDLKYVLLLAAGAKRKQKADIDRAVEHWLDYQQRSRNP